MALSTDEFPLTNLPEELISAIASNVSCTQDLFNLALASKQLNRITTQHLYHHVSLLLGVAYSEYQILQDLIILLLERPELAIHVHRLTIRGEWTKSWIQRKARRVDELHPVLQSAIERLTPGVKSKRAWAQNVVGWEKEEALVALLLHVLPNLEALDTNIPAQPGMHYRWLMKEIAAKPPRALGRLKDIMLVFSDRTPLVEPYMYMPYFGLPHLKRVFLYDVEAGMDPIYSSLEEMIATNLEYVELARKRRASSSISTLSPIEHLEIRGGMSSFELICNLIAACHSLHSFVYEYRSQDDDWVNGFYPPLISTLAIHADTLTTLSLSNVNRRVRAYRENALDFRSLPNLEHLKLAVGRLHIWKTSGTYPDVFQPELPQGLRKITIVHVRHDLSLEPLALLRSLLDDEAKRYPRLEEFVLYSNTNERRFSHRIRYAAAKVGIRLRIFVRNGKKMGRRWGVDNDICWQIIEPNEPDMPWNLQSSYVEYIPDAEEISTDEMGDL